MKSSLKGFTLVELLVVITLIAILAVAVLATINPIEQRNRGRDTNAQAAAREYISAQERYYASFGCYTFNDGNGTGSLGTCPTSAALPTTQIAAVTYNSNLVAADEVKNNLITRIATIDGDYDMKVSTDANEVIHVCFVPDSTTFKAKATYNGDASSTTGGTYYCLPDIVE